MQDKEREAIRRKAHVLCMARWEGMEDKERETIRLNTAMQRAAYVATPAAIANIMARKAGTTDGQHAASLLNTAKQHAANEAKNKTAAAPESGTDATMASRVAALLLCEAAAARINAANGIATVPADPSPPTPDPERMDG
jgi:hypothetical protein